MTYSGILKPKPVLVRAFFFYLLFMPGNVTFSQELINLAGEWQFRLDPENKGIEEKWYQSGSFDDIIRLPGCLQEQGYGEIPGIDTKWWGGETLNNWFKASPWLKEYREPGNFKTQAWLVPDRHYIGAAWYLLKVNIPDTWRDKHVTLFLERAHWETRLWVDGTFIGVNKSLGTPHIYDLSRLKSGKHVIVLRVDNSQIVKLGKMAYSVSEQTAGTWNGIIGRLELKAEAPVWIDNFRIYPDIDKNTVKVKGSIATVAGEMQNVKWSIAADVFSNNGDKVAGETVSVNGFTADSLTTSFEFELQLGDTILFWDEFDPNLYKMQLFLKAEAGNKTYTNIKEQMFGMRKFAANGRQFTVNDITTFLRGNVDCADNPKTGYPPMDVDSWRKIWRTYKEFGLNMARFHSWCPPEAAFVAADEEGVYLAPEVGEWAYISNEKQFDFLTKESLNILKTYGNHPCFIQMALGNESSGKKKFFYDLVELWKKTDPRHLYTIKANSRGNPANIDYEVVRGVGKPYKKMRYQGGWPPGPMNTEFHTRPPQTVINWDKAVQSRNIPLIQHENAQICAYPDVFNEMAKYTGYLRPAYLEIAADQLRQRGMVDQLPGFVEASGKWQVELTKEEFEAAYRTKEMAGFHWLSLNDFTGQNTAPVGFTDAFFDPKPYVKASEVRRWNAPTVLLALMEKRVYTTEDTLKAVLEVSHYGKENLLLEVTARLKKADGTILKEWKQDKKEFAQGSAQKIGRISFLFRDISEPVKLTLELESVKNHLFNKWDIWVFPENRAVPFPKSIIVTKEWNSAVEKKLRKGKSVLLLPSRGSLKGKLPICFTNYYWTSFGANKGQSSAAGILINDKHPIFKDFPTENHTNWQWWDMLTRCRPMILDSYDTENPWPHELKPVVQPIDSWKINRKLALVVEARVGKGRLLICSIDIEKDLDSRPAARQFRQGLIKYISSKSFDPDVEVSFEMIRELFSIKENNDGNDDSNMPSDG